MARNRIHKPPPPPPKNMGKKPRSGDDDFFDDFSKDKMDSIINWELHSKMQKPTEIKTEFDFKKEPKEKKNKIKNEGKYIIAKFIKKENRPKTTHFYFAYYNEGKYTESLGTGIKYSILNSEEETRLINNLEINSFYKAKLHEDYPESIIVNPSKKVIDTLEIKLAGFEINE